MLKKNIHKLTEFLAGDATLLKEALHPKNDAIDLPYSIAFARLEVGTSSLPHRLTINHEVYFFSEGTGKIYINGASQPVTSGDIVVVPPNASQWVENTGTMDLQFWCLVSPPWSEETEVVEK